MKEMEEEAAKLREMQAQVERDLGAAPSGEGNGSCSQILQGGTLKLLFACQRTKKEWICVRSTLGM